MLNQNFVHLHLHNTYSFLDGYGTAEQYAEKAKELGFQYIGVTNHGNVDGCLKWQKACDKIGILPVVGAELYLVDNVAVKNKKETRRHITILVKNQTGWEQLCAIITRSNLEGFYRKPRVDYNMLISCDMSGWIVMSACIGSFLNDIKDPFSSKFNFIKQINDQTQFYYEIMPHLNPMQAEYHKRLQDVWDIEGDPDFPPIATCDAHYIMPEDVEVQSVMLAIARNVKWTDANRWSMDKWQLYLRTADEMVEEFKLQNYFDRHYYLKAMRNTIKIAEQCCNFRIEEKKISLPVPPKYEKYHIEQEFDVLIEAGLREKGLYNNQIYLQRIEEESKVIAAKNFELYFLIVKDIIDWCKENDIMVGPGRGSVGGSLIAYLLGITQVDPIKYNLLFSRFLSGERGDWPDIDIDFERDKRGLVIEYIRKTYGKYNVAGISTFSKLHSRGSIRDVGRIFDLPALEVDRFAKSIPYNEENGIQKAIENPSNKEFIRKYSKEIKYAQRLEGQIRNHGQHAAGVIISSEDLRNGSRCALRLGKNKDIVINWAMEDAEHNGLIKLDILGLSTLSVLNAAKKLINKKIDFEYEKIPLDDQATLDTINSGKLSGLFQITGKTCAGVIEEMGVGHFNDIVAVNAIARSGPLKSGITKEYIRRKTGQIKDWDTIHPIYHKITETTYGMLIYQEQIMKVISEIAGLSEAVANKIRKVIGKKRDAKEFEPYWEMFLNGCRKSKTFTDRQAEKFWNELQSFAGYAFNLSHSVEYSLIGYWTSFLKTHYPVEFYCAVLTHGEFDQDSIDKSKQGIIDEIFEKGWKVLPPKIDKSDACKWTFEDDIFYMPFTEIKGIGEAGASNICCKNEERKECTGLKSFFDPKDLEKNISNPQLPKQTDQLLKKVGAYKPDLIPNSIDQYLEFNILGSSIVWDPTSYIKRTRWRQDKVINCKKCNLYRECKQPIPTCIGQTNIFILGEAPGKDEDAPAIGRLRLPFVGRAGQLLWQYLNGKGYTRRYFHIANTCRCYPSKTKTPEKRHIETCFDWTLEEIKETGCKLILALGNVAQYALTKRSGGIESISGETEYISGTDIWVCWGIHPSALLRQKSQRKLELFQKGISNFIDMIEKE